MAVLITYFETVGILSSEEIGWTSSLHREVTWLSLRLILLFLC